MTAVSPKGLLSDLPNGRREGSRGGEGEGKRMGRGRGRGEEEGEGERERGGDTQVKLQGMSVILT